MNSAKILIAPADDEGKILIAAIGGEGGGAKIYGHINDNAWLFWHEGVSMDADDEDSWVSFRSEPVPELDEALPFWWMNAYPKEINPSFIPWFKDRYEQHCKNTPAPPDDFCSSDRDRWLEVQHESRKTQL